LALASIPKVLYFLRKSYVGCAFYKIIDVAFVIYSSVVKARYKKSFNGFKVANCFAIFSLKSGAVNAFSSILRDAVKLFNFKNAMAG